MESNTQKQLNDAADWRTFLLCLPDVQQEILRLNFGLNGSEALGVTEISECLGLSVTQVLELRDGALRTLRAPWEEQIH